MKHINQHNAVSCLPTAIYMVDGNTGFKTIKNYCRKHFNYNMSTGCTTQGNDVMHFLNSLGHDSYVVAAGEFTGIHKATNFNKAVCCMTFPSVGIYQRVGHAVAWDGSRFYDPSGEYKKAYTAAALFKNYPLNGATMTIICVRLTPLQRLFNSIKFYFYSLPTMFRRTS